MLDSLRVILRFILDYVIDGLGSPLLWFLIFLQKSGGKSSRLWRGLNGGRVTKM
jgi:hypothetical protein